MPIQPQTPTLGQDLQTPPDPGVVQGPPATPEEAATRKEQWKQVLGSPEFGAALTQFAINISQPRATVDTGLAATTRAVGSGFEAADRVVQQRQNRDITERQQQVSERGAATQERQVTTQEGELALNTRKFEEKELPESGANIEGTKATTEATRGAEQRAKEMAPILKEIEEARVELITAQSGEARAAAEARLKNAQSNRINALANRARTDIAKSEQKSIEDLRAAQAEAAAALGRLRDVQAESGGFGGSATLQHLNALAGSIQRVSSLKGVELSFDEARLQAQRILKTTAATSREDFVQNMVTDYIESQTQFGDEPTDEQIMKVIKQAEIAADVMGLASIDTTSGLPQGAGDQGRMLETFEEQKAFIESKGLSLGGQQVQGVDLNGNTTEGLPVLDKSGAQLIDEASGLPKVVVP